MAISKIWFITQFIFHPQIYDIGPIIDWSNRYGAVGMTVSFRNSNNQIISFPCSVTHWKTINSVWDTLQYSGPKKKKKKRWPFLNIFDHHSSTNFLSIHNSSMPQPTTMPAKQMLLCTIYKRKPTLPLIWWILGWALMAYRQPTQQKNM